MEFKSIEGFQVHSEEIHEIISTPPNWATRWGNTLLFAFFILLFILAFIIKYPTVIAASVKITTSPSPITVVAKQSGQLRLIIENNSNIRKGDIIAVYHGAEDYSNIIKLEGYLNENIDDDVVERDY